jgi:hypothetical protein
VGGKGVLFGLFAVVFFAVLLGALIPRTSARSDQSTLAGEPQSQQVLGPGKVHLTFTRDGRWLEFAPSWTGGQSLFSVGGLIVYAKGLDGRLIEVVNTATGDIHVSENATRIRKCCEGTQGGFRAPSPDPDDDHDGRVDEDRLDGIDNDGDGGIDEDFAAIGDEMIATSYFAPAVGGTGTQLAFHQESYAWGLPHIDGTVMVSVSIKNIGSETLEDVRVGAFVEKDGPFYFSKWVVSLPGEREVTHANVIVCEDLQGTNMGLVIFPRGNVDGGLWMGGVAENPEKASAAILGRMNSTPRSGLPGAGKSSFTTSPLDASVLKSEETRVNEKALVYQASPGLGTLHCGDEIRVDLALFAVREKTDVEAAAINAFKTFVGDGTNRYLPPPVSMTPRVLWGSYRQIGKDDSGRPRVAVELEALGDKPVTPGEISYFNGIDPDAVERIQVEPGVEKLVLRGDVVQKSLRKGKGERIILKGRLENGEFFEAILRPQEGVSAEASVGDDAELFWKTEGKLELDLLSSSPNPFRDVTTIYYEVPRLIEQQDGARIETEEPLEISVKVYNVTGRLVSMLVEETLPPGTYTTRWRAVDDQGNVVASGVYYVRLQIGKKFLTRRLILLK